jgi:hypothetical protein
VPSDDVPGVVRRVECAYSYGAECRVACDEPPEVPIELYITWSAPYCCGGFPFPPGDDRHFVGCRCVDGVIQCGDPSMRSVPRTWCDLCGIPDAGRPGVDAGTDAR